MVQKIIVNNILSFGSETTFSLVPDRGLRSHPEHIIKVGRNRSLRGAIIFGPNAAGKSNLLKCVEILRMMFEANTCRVAAGSQFAMAQKSAMAWIVEYSFKNSRYKYVLTTDGDVVLCETLFWINDEGIEELLFSRFNKRGKVIFGTILGDEAWYSQRTLSLDSLLLRKFELDALDNQPDNMQGKKILQYAIWGLHSIHVIHSNSLITPDAFGRLLNMSNFRDFLADLMRRSDVGISDMSWQKVSPSKLKYVNIGSIGPSANGLQILPLKESFIALQCRNGKIFSAFEFRFSHKGYWMRADQESEGTLRLMHLSAFLYLLKTSESTWFIDELDCHLHPHISKWLLQNALSTEVKSQLVVTAHDTNLMIRKLWRTDEVWLVEKRMDGSTNMNTLRQLRGPLTREMADGYINGLYGAIPHVGGDMV